MDLFRNLLDAPLVDRHKRALGRVDGITLDVREGRPPRVTMMNVGAGILADRVHAGLGRVVRHLLAVVLGVSAEGASIPMHAIRNIGVDVVLNIDGERDPALLQTEKRLRGLIRRIPGGAT